MKNWDTLDADVVRLMNKHYTIGRSGHRIEMVVIHHNAGILSIDQIWNVWQTRQASAHYQVESGGRIGQLVFDRDTAWHAANSNINARSIGIEVSNSGGATADWPITNIAIEETAHLTAAICRLYKLGRPKSGTNVRFHREFTSTSCPYHLAPGGKYHNTLMDRAAYWYDNPTGAAGHATKEELDVDQADRIIKHLQDFIVGYLSPLIEDTKDNRFQLTGSRDNIPGDVHASYPGFEQLGKNADGQNLTLVDAVAALRRDVDDLKKGK